MMARVSAGGRNIGVPHPHALRIGVGQVMRQAVWRITRTPPALVFLLFGVLALSTSSWLANLRAAPSAPALAVACLAALGLAYGAFALSALREPPAWARALASILIWPLALWALWTAPQGIAVIAHTWPLLISSPRFYGSDALYYQHYNAWLLLHGENPYAGQRLTE